MHSQLCLTRSASLYLALSASLYLTLSAFLSPTRAASLYPPAGAFYRSATLLPAAADCNVFTVGECDPNRDELIDEYGMPDGPLAVASCQLICQVQEGCNYFTYSSAAETCSLYHYRYLASCQLVGGAARPAIDECSQQATEADSCNSYVRENCAYGRVIFSKSSVTDAHSCQALLAILGSVYGAEYFVYDSKHHVCIFYESQEEMTCSAISGPRAPSVEECGIVTTAPATTTTDEQTTLEGETTIEKETSVRVGEHL